MKKRYQLSNVTIFICSLLALTSCGELFTPYREFISLSALEKSWLADDSHKVTFALNDTLSELEIFEYVREYTAFNKSIHGDGFNREETEYEIIYQEFYSKKSSVFSIRIEANELPQGAILIIHFKGLRFTYDLKYEMLRSFSTPLASESLQFKDSGYENESSSYIDYYDTLTINNTLYLGVLDFTLKDFEDQWVDSTVVELAIAKEMGLIRYTMNNGVVMVRE